MIKSILEDVKSPTSEEYPCLKISGLGNIVLFSGPSTGTIVHSEDCSYYKIGEHSSNWAKAEFKDYKHKVTLINI